MSDNITVNEMVELAITSHERGGFQLPLPGKHFDMMNQVSTLPTINDPLSVHDRYKKYHEEKEEFTKVFTP